MGAPCGDGSEAFARSPCSGEVTHGPATAALAASKFETSRVRSAAETRILRGHSNTHRHPGLRSGRPSLRCARGLSGTRIGRTHPRGFPKVPECSQMFHDGRCAREERRRGTKPIRGATPRHKALHGATTAMRRRGTKPMWRPRRTIGSLCDEAPRRRAGRERGAAPPLGGARPTRHPERSEWISTSPGGTCPSTKDG